MKKMPPLIALALTGALTLTACGDEETPATTESASETSSSEPTTEGTAQFNDADVQFAQSMIPHHQQAIEMAQMAETNAQSDQVKELAARIEEAQGPEIEQLTTWLEEWGAEVPSGSMDHGDMGHGDAGSGMSGMMTEEDMGELEAASGAEWDQMFLTMMIEHHTGAVEMARTQVEDGKNRGAVTMAEEIIATQEAEIRQMKEMLGS
jgi:uncharacterized protein (DUF305 family)